jgi:hypothetical protein
MLVVRWLVLLLLLVSIVCFALYIGTNERRYLRFGVVILKWTVIAGLGFFAVLILEHLTRT